MGKINCIIKRPDEPVGHMTSISCTLKNLQNHVEGRIEAVTLREGLVVICNEEGLILGLPHNCTLNASGFYGDGISFFGTIIVIGASGEEFTDIPITFKEYKEMLYR